MSESPDPHRFAAASALVAAANALFRRGRDGSGRRRGLKGDLVLPVEFDATITLHFHLREAGLDGDRASDAVRAVRAAERAMPGAGWIDVEHVGPS